jgi:hypothetical protein
MWKIKFANEDVRWHEFTAEQKDTVASLCVMCLGVGVALGLVV